MPWARWRGTRFSPFCLISEKMILLSMILLNTKDSLKDWSVYRGAARPPDAPQNDKPPKFPSTRT